MDFLNNANAQLRDLLGSMTPGARIVATLLLAVVVISVTYLFQQGASGPDEYLFGGEPLPASQLNRIEGAIAKAGLSGHERDGRGIRVPAGRKSEFMAAVANEGALPPNFHSILESAISSGSPWESREMTRQRLKIARQQTLSEIVRAMDWVEEAAVLIDVQSGSGLSRNRQAATATISVKPTVGESVDPRRTRVLQRLVAHSVAELQPDEVMVTSLGDESSHGPGSAGYADLFDNEYYQSRVKWEQYKKDSILEALAFIPGVRVEVNAVLDDISSETSHDVKPEKEAVAELEETKSDTETTSIVDNGGPPGLDAQGPVPPPNRVAEDRTRSERIKEESKTQNKVGHKTVVTTRTGALPKEVWAIVAVPTSYLEAVWQQQNPGPSGQAPQRPQSQDLVIVQNQVKQKVENLVEPLLDGHKGEDNYKYVSVEFVESIAPPPIPVPTMADTALAWTGRNWGTISMMGLAVFSMLMLRSIVKAPPAENPPGGVAGLALESAEATGVDTDGNEEDESPPRPKLRLKKGPTLKDDLVEMVRDDPDAAAAILRNWIGKAA